MTVYSQRPIYKTAAVCAAIILYTAGLSGCQEIPRPMLPVSQPAVPVEQESEIAPESVSKEPDPVITWAESVAIQFLSALQERDTASLCTLTGAQNTPDLFDDIGSVVVDHFSIELQQQGEIYTTFRVNLSIAESQSEIFPVGKSVWTLRVPAQTDDGSVNIAGFFLEGSSLVPSEDNIELEYHPITGSVISYTVKDRIFYMAEQFVSDCTDLQAITQEQLSKRTPDISLTGFCVEMLLGKYGLYPEETELPLSKISSYMEKTLGIPNLDISPDAYAPYLAPGSEDMVILPAETGARYVCALAGTEATDSMRKVLLRFYADTAYIHCVREIEVNFSLETPGYPRILSVSVLLDTGIPPLSISA